MNYKELIRRYTTFVVSVFIIAFGLSAVVRSNLGVSPISSTPYVFSLNTPPTIGTYLFILCLLFIVVQMAMMNKETIKKSRFDLLIQVPISFVFGMCTDLTMWILRDLQPQTYTMQMITLVIGCIVLAVGICLEVVAGVAMMGAEYTVQMIAKKSGKEFGIVKLVFDISLVCLAITSSLLFSSKIEGIREGTIITALITGPFVKLIMPYLKAAVDKWHKSPSYELQPEVCVAQNGAVLITISREYGSGGHAIGKMLSERLAIPFYDKDLIEMVAKEGNFSEKFVNEHEQKLGNSFYNMILSDYEAPLEKSLSAEDLLFVAQSKVLNRIAEKGSCVIVGRCASYILDRYPNNISVFLHANLEHKTARVVEQYGISKESAADKIVAVDRARAAHFYHYTGKKWGDARSYQLCCDSGLFTPEQICNSIEILYKNAVK